ncbi:hypothetical protein RYH73_14900 [Olivibacter sp. CPCC 100613]|uniref:hypothetical protein n=1 Tax=Olivibacter sp. CPCC 100613 TaxID=3079931 RepID=UPI002FFC2B19
MCGMNAKDIHDLRDEDIINGRVEYNRSKTTGRRDDDAFISIKIVDEVKPLLDKYLNVLRDRYSTFENLDHALAKGMEQICRKFGWEEKAEEEAVAKAAKFKSKDKASTVLKSERISELENELEVLTKKVAELETELVHRDQIVGAKDETIEVLKKYVSSLEKDKVDLKIELEAIREKFFTKTGARKSG